MASVVKVLILISPALQSSCLMKLSITTLSVRSKNVIINQPNKKTLGVSKIILPIRFMNWTGHKGQPWWSPGSPEISLINCSQTELSSHLVCVGITWHVEKGLTLKSPTKHEVYSYKCSSGLLNTSTLVGWTHCSTLFYLNPYYNYWQDSSLQHVALTFLREAYEIWSPLTWKHSLWKRLEIPTSVQ